jgi:hypothetical protein
VSTNIGYLSAMMATSKSIDRGYRFPAEIIQQAVCLALFPLSAQPADGRGPAGSARDRRQPPNRAVLGRDVRTDPRQQDPSAQRPQWGARPTVV